MFHISNEQQQQQPTIFSDSMLQNPEENTKAKKKRNLPGNPDPDAEVIALSPKTLMATNRFICEICNKRFQRDQNLQLHRRGHNLPWKLKQKSNLDRRKKAYVCPEPSCPHHHPSRALGDLTGIKKHYCRKHGEKKWKCDKCTKIYAVQSDWKAHTKTCGTREYRCDCGTLFSRKDSFITHRAFCEALAEESARLSAATNSILAHHHIPNDNISAVHSLYYDLPPFSGHHRLHYSDPPENQIHIKPESLHIPPQTNLLDSSLANLPQLSATALLQKAATVGPMSRNVARLDMHDDGFTRDFLGLSGNIQSDTYDVDDDALLKHHGFGFTETCSQWGNHSFF